MPSLIVFLLALALFCLAFFFSGIISNCKNLLAISRRAFDTIRNKSLNDRSKEKIVQAASLDMLKQTFALLTKIIFTLGLTITPMLAADALHIVSFEQSSHFALRIDVLVVTSVLIVSFLAIKP